MVHTMLHKQQHDGTRIPYHGTHNVTQITTCWNSHPRPWWYTPCYTNNSMMELASQTMVHTMLHKQQHDGTRIPYHGTHHVTQITTCWNSHPRPWWYTPCYTNNSMMELASHTMVHTMLHKQQHDGTRIPYHGTHHVTQATA